MLVGIAQCAELCWQLRGLAGKRQVNNARIALQHNIGLGGAVVVALYRLGFPGYSHRYVVFVGKAILLVIFSFLFLCDSVIVMI